MNFTEPIFAKSQLLSNIVRMSSILNYIESAKRYENYVWKFICVLVACTEQISNKLASSREYFEKGLL